MRKMDISDRWQAGVLNNFFKQFVMVGFYIPRCALLCKHQDVA